MSEIAELERRITAALARIGQGLSSLSAAPSSDMPEDVRTLQEALEAERVTNAQLTERVRAIKDRQENLVGQLERRAMQLSRQLEAAGAEVQRLKSANHEMETTLAALREAAESGEGIDAHLVNRAMQAELESLRSVRMAEVVELDEILAELKPLIGEEHHA